MNPGAWRRPFLGLVAVTLVTGAAMAQTSFILRNGDVDKSGEVNDSDLTNVILDYSSTGPFPTANGWTDLTGDGLVDDGDLTAVILGYGEITVTLSGTPASPEGDFLLRADIELGEYFGSARFPVHLRARNLTTSALFSYDSPSVPDTIDPWLGSAAATYEMQLPDAGEYDVQVYVTDSTLTIPNRWSTWIGKVVHTLGPSEDTIAAGTGPQKVTVYWAGVPNASGYNLYRAATSGGELVKVNGSLITSLDPGPGLTNAYRCTDTGRTTDEEVFYRVTAVDSQGVEGIYGEEARATPATNSIPWDSDDPAAITAACKQVVDSQVFSAFGQPVAEITAQGPNGVVYQSYQDETPPTASPCPGVVDGREGVIIDSEPDPDQPVVPVTMEDGQLSGTPGSWKYNPTNPPTGVFRKVEAVPGAHGLRSHIWLPATGSPDTDLHQGTPDRGSLDTAYIYTGGVAYGASRVKGEELDAGFVLQREGDPGWKIWLFQKPSLTRRMSSSALRRQANFLRRTAGRKYWIGPGQVFFVFGASGAGSGVTPNTCFLSVPAREETSPNVFGPVRLMAFFCALRGWSPSDTVEIKRVNSIAQALKQPDNVRPTANDPQGGYFLSGSYIRGAAWGNPAEDPYGVKLTPGGLWDEDLTRRYDATTYYEGSFPARGPVINWLVQNAYFWETHININIP